ncbi:MAG: glycosyltransferase family 4 protein [Planctomycetes bacterium]|nr:glycosyltransferase family 4 protein [Planctomycetota bacterium]
MAEPKTDIGGSKHVAVVRGSAWDTTQAAPRVVSVLRELGFKVTVLCWDFTGQQPAREQADGLEILRYGRKVPKAGAKFFLSWPLWWRWLRGQFLRHRFDIVHVMNLDCAIPAVQTRRRAGHKIVYDIRDAWGLCLTGKPFPLPQVFSWLDRVFSHRVDGLLLSQGMLEFCAAYHGAKAARTVPVVQVLNVPQEDVGAGGFRPAGSSAELTLNYSGRISEYRGAYLLPEAVRGTPWRLHVYGKNPNAAVREHLAAAPQTTVEGPVPLETSLKYLDQADLVSILYDPAMKVVFISSANKMFEAMMLGKPYLCTEGSFPACVARAFDLGWALPYGDVAALRSFLLDLAAHPEKLAQAGRNGRAAYEAHFQWDRQKRNLIDLYRYLTGDPEVVPRPRQGWDRFIGEAYSFPPPATLS